MKVWLALILGAAFLSLTGANSEPSLVSYATHISDLTKITSAPLKMKPIVATQCARFTPQGAEGIHTDKYFDVYVTSQGSSILKSGVGTYPENTVVLKRKYSDSAGKTTELYTGMIKRGKGYNPQGGDWEYFVISGDGQKVLQNGALTSCMQCHQAYQASDYVTRTYLTESILYNFDDRKN